MVQEVRRIMFSHEELVSALEGYRRMTAHFMPDGEITACVAETDAISVTLKTGPKNAPTTTTHTFRGSEAVKPLVRFCLENNIMMPRDGQKSLYVKDGVASLYIVYNLDLNLHAVSAKEPLASPASVRAFSPADIVKVATAVT